jgi:hypothetical protein
MDRYKALGNQALNRLEQLIDSQNEQVALAACQVWLSHMLVEQPKTPEQLRQETLIRAGFIHPETTGPTVAPEECARMIAEIQAASPYYNPK